MSGEGISCGSRPRRKTIKIASTRPMNSTSGINRYLFMLFNGAGSSGRSDLHNFRFGRGLRDLFPGQRVTPIANRESAANGHQQGAAPNPVHQRLVIDAYGPAAVLGGVAE